MVPGRLTGAQGAESRLSALIAATLAEGPQRASGRGKPVAVVLSAARFGRPGKAEQAPRNGLGEHPPSLRPSPGGDRGFAIERGGGLAADPGDSSPHLLVAATALARGLAGATGTVSDFAPAGVPTVNPFAP